jgi:hypothetical protein
VDLQARGDEAPTGHLPQKQIVSES